MVKREDNMAKGKDKYPSNAYEYTDWLYTSNRITAEEHNERCDKLANAARKQEKI